MLIYKPIFNIYRFKFWFINNFGIFLIYIPKHNIKKIYFLHKITIFKKLISYSITRVF